MQVPILPSLFLQGAPDKRASQCRGNPCGVPASERALRASGATEVAEPTATAGPSKRGKPDVLVEIPSCRSSGPRGFRVTIMCFVGYLAGWDRGLVDLGEKA